jgi:hypothetical protein
VNAADIMPMLLLLLFSLALSVGTVIVFLIVRHAGHRPIEPARSPGPIRNGAGEFSLFRRPNSWLAIKSRNLLAVQSALGLHNPKPCSWLAGLAGEEKLFIAPPVRGWILVLGSGLPDPSEDVDACFRFVCELSRRLGQVQYFGASRIVHHHAWIRADGGRVIRAYAWAGRTVWQQGCATVAEKELGLKCFDYGETVENNLFGQPDVFASNADKVPLLAARWSLDPAGIEEKLLVHEQGVSGEPSGRY